MECNVCHKEKESGEVPHPLGYKFVKGFSIKKVSD